MINNLEIAMLCSRLLRTRGSTFTPGMQRVTKRMLFIQTQETPNPNAMKFLPGRTVVGDGEMVEFSNAGSSHASPLARQMFRVDGVRNVLYGNDFVSVTKDNEMPWEVMKPEIFGVITEFFMSGEELITNDTPPEDTEVLSTDSDVVTTIKELLDTRIRPMVHEDGGDIEYRRFDDGVVYLKMKGACSSCPSSEATLKHGIQNMLQHYVPEVVSVEQEVEEVAQN